MAGEGGEAPRNGINNRTYCGARRRIGGGNAVKVSDLLFTAIWLQSRARGVLGTGFLLSFNFPILCIKPFPMCWAGRPG